jgi:hypothetical protein
MTDETPGGVYFKRHKDATVDDTKAYVYSRESLGYGWGSIKFTKALPNDADFKGCELVIMLTSKVPPGSRVVHVEGNYSMMNPTRTYNV